MKSFYLISRNRTLWMTLLIAQNSGTLGPLTQVGNLLMQTLLIRMISFLNTSDLLIGILALRLLSTQEQIFHQMPRIGSVVLMHDIHPITPKILPYLLRVYTGLNPYPKKSSLYNKLEKFVADYGFSHNHPLHIVGLNDLKHFDRYDQRFSKNGHRYFAVR